MRMTYYFLNQISEEKIIEYFCKNNNISKEYLLQHPSWQNKDGWTVAMALAINKIIPSKEWHHKPELQDKYGYTVAMILAFDGIIPPKEWYHDPSLRDKLELMTVAMQLSSNRITPPKEWLE